MNSRTNIEEAKRRLSLPQLMEQLGHSEAAKKSARCPFHQDANASFSTFQDDAGAWRWKCFAGCGQGDEIEFLAKVRNVQNGAAVRDFLKMAGVDNAPQRQYTPKAFDWPQCVAAFTVADAQTLAHCRGLSFEFVQWLHRHNVLGIYDGKTAFANHGHGGKVVSCHYRLETGKWKFEPTGQRTAPLVFGNTKAAGFILAFESQWDAFAVMDKLGWHAANSLPDTAVLITRGASNGKLIRGQLSPDAVCYAFTQNDTAAQTWLADIAAAAGCRVLNVATPTPYKDANDWTRADATKADIEAAMRAAKPVDIAAPRAETSARADSDGFDKITAEIRGEILGILTDANCKGSARNREVAKLAVSALAKVGRLYFHAERRDFDSAMFFDATAKRLWRIRSDAFVSWFSEWLGINRADPLFKFAFAEVETAALSTTTATAILPESFWAARPAAIYLSNGDGALAKITAGKVETVDNGSDGVLFAAGNTLAPWTLAEPQDPFETCSLFGGANCAASHGLDLLRLWILSLPTNTDSKPPLCLAGVIGSGKTQLAKGVARLYGLPEVINKVEDFGEDSFWASMDAGGLFTADNCDTRNKWLPDAVAAAATDGCSQRRKKYTDAERVTLRARAWLCLTTANPTFASDAGLADRLLVVRMNRRTGETSDKKLSDDIRQHRNSGLSFIAQTIATAIADKQPTPGGLNQRHPDFAAFAVRLGRALGREAEAVAALRQAEQDKSAFCLENDPIGTALLAFLRETQTFTGTAAELVPHLVKVDSDLAERLSAKRLGKRLAAIWPHLQSTLATAKREPDRFSVNVFTFKMGAAAGFAGFQTPLS